MKNRRMEVQLQSEVVELVQSRKSLFLSSLDPDGNPYASYAPYALGEECLYVLLSEIALHAVNLQRNPRASVLIIEDEDGAGELFARVRVNYSVNAHQVSMGSAEWQEGLSRLSDRLGERIELLSQLSDFKLFRLEPLAGRYVKGFARAYTLVGGTLAGKEVDHLTDGHRDRASGEED